MNILHISVRADFGGGPEHLYQQISCQLEYHDIQTFIACPDDYPYFSRYLNFVERDKILIIPHRKFSMFNFFKILWCVFYYKIHIIHSHGKGAGIYGRLLNFFSGIPCVHTFHGLHVGEYSIFKKRMYIYLERMLGKFTEKIICVSLSELKNINSEGIVPFYKLAHIDNGVKNSESVTQRPLRSKLKILSVNRYDDQKNPELLIAIAKSIKASTLYGKLEILVIGDGQKFSRCKKDILDKNLDDVITLHGPTTNPRQFMAEADIFLSTSRWEGMPLAVLEAMSEGAAILATNVVGNSDVIQHCVEGFLFNDNDPLDALKGLQALSNSDFRNKCALAARKSVSKKYSVKKMVESTVELYKEVLQK